ncbi:MAG: hypothetical protein WBM28_00100, partial [Burkholderiales bacterium]
TRTISTARAIILIAVAPSRLIAHSVDHAIRSQPGVLDADREMKLRAQFEAQFRKSISTIRSALFGSFVVVASSVIAAFASGVVLNKMGIAKSAACNVWLQFGGIGVLLWATLARVDPSAIQTYDGGTLPERVDLWLYRSLYVVGSYALALSVSW